MPAGSYLAGKLSSSDCSLGAATLLDTVLALATQSLPEAAGLQQTVRRGACMLSEQLVATAHI